ncbi:MAG TPA: hypothetical protein VFZ55_00720 [Nitrososphaera sp.]
MNSDIKNILVMVVAFLAVAVSGAISSVSMQPAYAQEATALTMEKEITNPSGEEGIDIQSAENSENAAARRTSTSSLSVQEGEDDTPANYREMTLKLPNDRTLFRIVESADESSGAAAALEAENEAEVELEQ